MITSTLHAFVDRVLDAKRITAEDLSALQRDVLPDGITCRDEVDVLVALDRAVPQLDANWGNVLIALASDFVVWTSRPTGYVDAESAQWLVTTLTSGSGPTETAVRLAFEVVREAESADERLLAFVMQSSRRVPELATERAKALRHDLMI